MAQWEISATQESVGWLGHPGPCVPLGELLLSLDEVSTDTFPEWQEANSIA